MSEATAFLFLRWVLSSMPGRVALHLQCCHSAELMIVSRCEEGVLEQGVPVQPPHHHLTCSCVTGALSWPHVHEHEPMSTMPLLSALFTPPKLGLDLLLVPNPHTCCCCCLCPLTLYGQQLSSQHQDRAAGAGTAPLILQGKFPAIVVALHCLTPTPHHLLYPQPRSRLASLTQTLHPRDPA